MGHHPAVPGFEPYLLYPKNRGYFLGKRPFPVIRSLRPLLIMGIIWLVIVVVGEYLVLTKASILKFEPLSLLLYDLVRYLEVLILVFGGLVVGSLIAGRTGSIVQGSITSRRLDSPLKGSDKTWLFMSYEFTSPVSGKLINGISSKRITDPTKIQLPDVGTSAAILYSTDNFHQML